MKQKELLAIMQFHNVKLPAYGTGVNGRIVSRDLENAIGNHFFEKQFNIPMPARDQAFYDQLEDVYAQDDENKQASHMLLRRYVRPMKAYRYTDLPESTQKTVLEDMNGWIAEQKYNGWRIMITHIPGTPVRFYGGNLSTNTLLPVDYTNHLPAVTTNSDEMFILDVEAECLDTVIQQNGLPTTNTREAIAAILGSSVDVAKQIQLDAKVLFRVFDIIEPLQEHQPLYARKEMLRTTLSHFHPDTFTMTPYQGSDKKRMLHSLWKQGHEGIILKNIDSGYVSGGRLKEYAIKIKRTASGAIGDSIDAFISGFIKTPMYPNLIGGLRLSVYENGEPREIATITSIPDELREEFTAACDGEPCLKPKYYYKVLEIDGQELTSKNRRLLHAVVVSWTFRKDKNASDCVIESSSYEERF